MPIRARTRGGRVLRRGPGRRLRVARVGYLSRIGKLNRSYALKTYKFKRFGLDCQIVNTSAGAVNLNTTASGWALTGASTDVNGTYQFGGAMQFQLNQTLEVTDFATLFDRYKITGVKVSIIPLGSYSGGGSVQNQNVSNYPTIAIAVDSDDASLPGSWNQVAVKQGARVMKLNKTCSMYIKNPKLASAVFNGITNAYSQKTGYLDMNSTDVPHYGLKYWIRECPLPNPPAAAVTGANSMFRVVTKFYLSMKDPQ